MAKLMTVDQAESRGLIQLTAYALHTDKEVEYLNKEIDRILQDSSREAGIVKEGLYLALWVDNAAKRCLKNY